MHFLTHAIRRQRLRRRSITPLEGKSLMHQQMSPISESRRALLRAFVPVLGLISFTAGVGLAALSWTIVYKQFTFYGRLPREPFIYVSIFSLIALFCLVAGLRLMFLRKNRTASIMPPIVWNVLGGFFIVLSIVLLVKILLVGDYTNFGMPGVTLFIGATFLMVAKCAKPIGPDDPQIL